MKSFNVLLFVLSSIAFAQPPSIDEANRLLAEGKFDRSLALFKSILSRDAKNIEANRQASRICLYSNRLDEAKVYGSIVLTENPRDSICLRVMAEALRRENRFADAAPYFRLANQEPSALQMESFKDQQPYRLVSTKDIYCIKFVATDPLPLIHVRLMSSPAELSFFINSSLPSTIPTVNCS